MISRPHFPAVALTALALAAAFGHPAIASQTKEAEQAGAILFRDKGCAYCHGAALEGTPKGPALANIHKTWKAPQIAIQIENGGQKMPSFRDALTDPEIAQLVSYLRAKHRPTPSLIQSQPSPDLVLTNPAHP